MVSRNDTSDGDKLARAFATGLASLLVAAVLAGGGQLWALAERCTDTRARLDVAERGLRELYEKVGRYPDPDDVRGNRERITAAERDVRAHLDAADSWRKRIERLEQHVHDLMGKR